MRSNRTLAGRSIAWIAVLLSIATVPALATESKAAPQTAGATTDLSDAEILGITDTANGGVVEQASVATNKAQSDAVRSFAEGVLRDRTLSKLQGQTVAKNLGLSLTGSPVSTSLRKDSAARVTELHKADAPTFDRFYVAAQIEQQEKLLALFDHALVPQADAPKLKSLLTEMRRTIEHDIEAAKATLRELDSK